MLNLFKKSYESINQDKAMALMKDTQVRIVDVREPYEYEAGHIPGATLIPLGSLPSRLGELSKDKTYILVCASGARSGRGAAYLSKQGYKVLNLAGGMMAWRGKVKK